MVGGWLGCARGDVMTRPHHTQSGVRERQCEACQSSEAISWTREGRTSCIPVRDGVYGAVARARRRGPMLFGDAGCGDRRHGVGREGDRVMVADAARTSEIECRTMLDGRQTPIRTPPTDLTAHSYDCSIRTQRRRAVTRLFERSRSHRGTGGASDPRARQLRRGVARWGARRRQESRHGPDGHAPGTRLK